FFGRYIEVTPHSRLVWTNDEAGDSGPVTTVTFEEKAGKTLLILHELYPSKEALDAAGTGAADVMNETFEQLDELLATLGTRWGRSCRRRASKNLEESGDRRSSILEWECVPSVPDFPVVLGFRNGTLRLSPRFSLVILAPLAPAACG